VTNDTWAAIAKPARYASVQVPGSALLDRVNRRQTGSSEGGEENDSMIQTQLIITFPGVALIQSESVHHAWVRK
jgi:hypothetical protein